MPLLDLRTDLKSLKYGADRPGGGDSGLPYIKTDINNPIKILGKFDDGLIRGGIVGATKASVVDTLRIGKFLTDFPQGPLFIVRQAGLQLSNPRLEVPKNPSNIALGGLDNALAVSTNGLLEPTRIYNLGINTIAQIPVNAFGGHFNRHGILPVQTNASKYEAVITTNNDLGGSSKFNRLVGLTSKFKLGDQIPNQTTNKRITGNINTVITAFNLITGTSFKPLNINPKDLIIDDYAAGPGSTYGIGRTTIKRYYNTEDSFKINLLTSFSKQFAGKTRDEKGNVKEVNYLKDIGTGNNAISTYPDVSKLSDLLPTSNLPTFKIYAALQKQVEQQQQLKISGSNQFGIYNVTGSNINGSSNGSYSSKELEGIGYKNSYGDVVTINFKKWSEVSREKRIGSGRTDSINLTPLFRTDIGKDSATISISGNKYTINDLVKFRIQAIDTDNPDKGVYMVFRAYITSFEDSINAGWDPIKYIGRGEEFYIYNGYTRKINIGFKVAALSAAEMQPMYQKLNYLMSNLMPDYENTFMRGPLTRMTVGNWIDSQVGVINSLTYTVSNDSPWEIALNEPLPGGAKEMVLPHIIDVSLSFTPIGIQTKGEDQLAKKSNIQSNIAQNWNGKDEKSNYIATGSIDKIE